MREIFFFFFKSSKLLYFTLRAHGKLLQPHPTQGKSWRDDLKNEAEYSGAVKIGEVQFLATGKARAAIF